MGQKSSTSTSSPHTKSQAREPDFRGEQATTSASPNETPSTPGTTQPSPPAYGQADPTFSFIAAGSTARWNWANEHCRCWLSLVFTSRLGLSFEDATVIARKFEDFGPNVYLMEREDWKKLLGEKAGHGVYVWLLSVRNFRLL